ncbi:cytochrome c [Maritalea sp.]|uniref:cytochrome c n=1 Tax=Maritalea sp. TaxID=2003361 RepID=UPI003EF34A9A
MIFKIKHVAIYFGLALLVTPAISHGGASGPTLERMNAMSNVQKTLKQLRPALSDPSSNKAEIDAAFVELRTLGDHLPKLFQEKHMMDMSEALPKIWSSPEAFADEIEFYNLQIDKAEAAVGGDPKLMMQEIAKTCQSCHTQFREKKK